MLFRSIVFLLIFFITMPAVSSAQDTRDFKIFRFPANMIPSIDGKTSDWDIVGEAYSVGMDQLIDNRHSGAHKKPDPKDLDVKVKVGWVKGMNRLYFLYQAYGGELIAFVDACYIQQNYVCEYFSSRMKFILHNLIKICNSIENNQGKLLPSPQDIQQAGSCDYLTHLCTECECTKSYLSQGRSYQ